MVRSLEDLPEESAPGLLDYAAAPAEDVALVLAHSGGPKGSGLLTKLRKLPAVTEVKSARAQGRRSSPASWPTSCAAHGARIDPDAAEFLIQAVGQDLRSLAAAAEPARRRLRGPAADRRDGRSTSAAGPR